MLTKLFRRPLTFGHAFVMLVVVAAIGGGAYGVAATPGPDGRIKGCVKKRNPGKGTLRVIDHNKRCSSRETTLFWSQRGLQGQAGAQGVQGAQGLQGPAGSPDTGAEVLAKLLGVDGATSGLDADVIDGLDSTAFALAGHNHDATYVNEGQSNSVNAGMIPDITREFTIPLASLVECSSAAGSAIGFGEGVDANPDVINGVPAAGAGFVVRFDDGDPAGSEGGTDQGTKICGALQIPLDYASGGSFRIRTTKGAQTGADEQFQCAVSKDAGAQQTADTRRDLQQRVHDRHVRRAGRRQHRRGQRAAVLLHDLHDGRRRQRPRRGVPLHGDALIRRQWS